MSTDEHLIVKLWIDGALVVEETIRLHDAIPAAERHAERGMQAEHDGKNWCLEICDPDQDGLVVLRMGNTPQRMECPIRVNIAESLPDLLGIAKQRLKS